MITFKRKKLYISVQHFMLATRVVFPDVAIKRSLRVVKGF